MLRHCVKQGFSQFNVMGAFQTLKSVVTAPLRHMKALSGQDGNYNPTQINMTTDAFDEVAHEWIAVYTGNPFHLQIYSNQDNVQTTNFGTVDNPCVIFTADAPFRYVGCTGLQNEDDYEQHELHMFMLREGPLQRCPMCGQVFKLVRLRQEFDEEMQFYKDSFHPIDPFEMDNDNMMMMNILKINTHKEPSLDESVHIDSVMSMVEPDVHDRILTDPAYRLWRFKHHSDRYQVFQQSLEDMGYGMDSLRNPKWKKPLQKSIYESCIEAEKAFSIMERLKRKYLRFQVREYLDVENHERRERRMKQLRSERWDKNYTFYFGGLTEEEQQYNDYFQTDQEIMPEDEIIEQRYDEQRIMSQPEYNPNRFDFQETYTHNPEDDQTSLLQKKLFQYKYRHTHDITKNYVENQKRMINRQLQRMTKDPEYLAIFKNLADAKLSLDEAAIFKAEREYFGLVAKEGFLQYKDYYEGDPTADIELVEALFKANPTAFVPAYKNYATQIYQVEGHKSFPKRPWDEGLGVIQNFVLDFQDFQSNIAPKAERLANLAALKDVLPASEEELLKMGILKAEEGAKKRIKAKRPQQQLADK